MSVSPSTPSSGSASEAEAVVRLFGADPWMRFDIWAERSWEAAQGAIAVAAANGPSINSDDGLNDHIVALFHAAGVAKDFAEMLNPALAVCDVKNGTVTRIVEHPELTIDTLLDRED